MTLRMLIIISYWICVLQTVSTLAISPTAVTLPSEDIDGEDDDGDCGDAYECGLNEEYSSCANGGCRRFTCAINGILCVDLIEGGCKKGCICKASYTRADNGTCIPEDECPPTCGDNEVYDLCPSPCPPKRCDVDEQLIDCAPNPLPGDANCEPGCRCADNYYRNENGLCVAKEECPPLIECGPNEIALSCVNGGCWKESCTFPQTICGKPAPGSCKEGCRCKENYLRSNNGTCIPESDCPQTELCGPNEEYGCDTSCNKQCIIIDGKCIPPKECKPCKFQCRCKDGYTRNENGECISTTCGMNEVYDECPPLCPPQRCDVDDRLIRCAENPKPGDPKCKPGCRCADNFYRNDKGICVTREECQLPKKCGLNEEYSSCANGGCRRFTCAMNAILCVDLIEGGCEEGCICKESYTRADNGTCIPENQCPTVCGDNEVYDVCPSPCPPKRCDVDERLIDCAPNPLPGDPNCEPGCRCADNYYRNENGLCVTKEECPPIIDCGPNEIALRCANGGCWKRSCSRPQTICVKLREGACKEGCRCKENYLRSDNGTCIPESECPQNCGLNEIYDECPPTCPPQRCDIDNRVIKCKRTPMPGDPDCKPGCRCKDDFYRNDLGICVTRDECPPLIKCGDNEYASKCANGGCKKISCAEPITRCVKLPPGACEEGCLCKENYLRADNGTCIPEEECPNICGINEVYDYCPPICPPQRCDVDIATILCKPNPLPGDPECKPGCRCADNYAKNKDGICIPRDKCPSPSICDLNEEYSDCANGGCRRLSCNSTGIECVDLKDAECKPGCICKTNYTRADNGTCIAESQCPATCGVNEVYDECPPLCPPQRCDVDDRIIRCAANPKPGDPKCKAGCRCAEYYYRNDNGVCVTREECSKCFGANEVYACKDSNPQTCESIDQEIKPDMTSKNCKRECRCKEGFYRNKIGECISKENCLKCNGPNEFFSCGSACVNECRTIKTQNQTHCPIVNIVCNKQCYCEDGYAYDENKICIPISQCPPQPSCGVNEEYSDCANGGCRRWECSDNGVICKDLLEGSCEQGCVCKDSYTRDEDGNCIPEDQCPELCGPNEEYGCDTTCNKQCIVMDGKCIPPNKSKVCKLQCRCKDGYSRNENGLCVSTCDGQSEKIIDGLTEFEEGNLRFTESFLLTAAKNNPNASVIGSPFSILFLLAQLALYASGNSKTELLKLLNLSNDCEIRSFVPKYLQLISVTNNASFDLAQKIYGSVKYPFSENFKKDTREVFNAQAQNVDFSNPKEAADIINKWVAERTRNLIPNLISPDALSSNTRLVLANAIYFKGDWRYQFKARNTRLLPFYTGKTKDDSVQVKMMNQIGNFKYTELKSPDVQILQLPYKAADISFVICLPRSRTGINDLIKNLKVSSLIKRSFTELQFTRVDVSMPTLDISTTTDLKPLLFDAGVKAIFDPSTAGISGILEKPEDIFVTSGIQKAKILLNETGTEAAAATAVVVGVRSLPISEPDPVKFNADHSFIYFIMYKKIPIFAGMYRGT
ncbi:zonadhesin-like isoform X3 [Danaus plexippus]|uniref:zonadhesin-like isoform X3 n=1 Tax=Danaus plexippus TaxID=13037 RepID=UPI002AB20CC7|nr:zonadhesin-like isoform X3 [Danaus plexippus]